MVFPLIGTGLVTLFLLLILIKKNKQSSDYLLALFFILVGAELSYRVFCATGYIQDRPWLVLFDLVYWILLGPTIYQYSLFIINRSKTIQWKMVIHLIPLIIILIPFIHFLSRSTGEDFFTYAYYKNLAYRWIIYIFWEYCVLVYFSFMIVSLIRHKKILPLYFSSLKQKDLNWLIYLTSGFFLYILIATAVIYLQSYQIVHFSFDQRLPAVIILDLYLLGIGVFGYKQEGIFSQHAMEEISNLQFQGQIKGSPEKEFKYIRSGLGVEERDALIKNLKSLMRTEKPYTDCMLTIQDLASKLDTSVHKLSQVINEVFQENFFDFINSYRVEEVKKLLCNSTCNNLKIMTLAYDCGFNSKSAFYAAFKKITGTTPVEYRKNHQPEHARFFSN